MTALFGLTKRPVMKQVHRVNQDGADATGGRDGKTGHPGLMEG